MKQEINNAISEHALYKFRLNDVIQKGKLENPKGPCTETDCEFGKWFFGTEVSSRHRSSGFYKQVKQLHSDFHRIACQVAGLAAKGEKEEAQKMMEHEGEFNQVSNQLMETLIRWRNNV